MNKNNGDCYCSKAEIELFTNPPINIAMDSGAYAVHRPVTALTDDSPLEFQVTASPEEYLDLGRTKLHLKVKVTNVDGSNLAGDAKVSTSNLLMHSLFSQVDCKLNETLVSPSVNTYPYKAYLEKLLSYDRASKESWMSAEFYHKDTVPINSHDPSDNDANRGLIVRSRLIEKSKVVELIGRPHVDIFQQDRYLLPGIDMALRFTRSPKAFHLMGADVKGFKTVIVEAALHVRKVKINPTIALEHARTLDGGQNACYPLRRGIVTTFTIGTGSLSCNKENLLSGQLPRRLVLGFVSNTAFNGSSKQNPFNFQNLGLNFLTINAGSQQYPSQLMKPNFAGGEYTHAYNQLYQSLDIYNTSTGLDINMDEFGKGYTLYGFDLTADMGQGSYIDPIKYGSLRMEAHFDTAITAPMNVIVYAEYDNMLKIDRARNVVTDYAAS